jgi:hypothetical protein
VLLRIGLALGVLRNRRLALRTSLGALSMLLRSSHLALRTSLGALSVLLKTALALGMLRSRLV